MNVGFERLAEALNALGWTWWSFEDERCGRILVTERGARVLGLFAGSNAENGVWTNPLLFEPGGAKEWAGAWNAGGDRTWVAPEVRFFIERTGGREAYVVQGELDPGRYELLRHDSSGCVLVQATEIKDLEHGRRVRISVQREINLIPSPFHEKGHVRWSDRDVRFAGYELRVTLRAHGDYDHPIGIWNLLQVPAPGVMYVPTWYGVRPTVVFGDADSVLSTREGRGVRFEVDGRNRCKVSIPAVAAMGRLAYRSEASDGSSSLLIRNFFVNPSGAHVDAPWDAPHDRGYAVQCYGDDGAIGAFGEMEHHAAAIAGKGERAAGGARSRTDVSQTWHFKGPPDAIDSIFRRLLGAGVHL